MNAKLKKELAKSYQKMAKDKKYLKEMVKTAEMGMKHFLKIINP